MSAGYEIEQIKTPADIDVVRALFKAYTDWLDLDLTFQNYAAELSSLPGKYAPPAGALLLARTVSSRRPSELATATALAPDGALGCVALRPLPRQRSGSTSDSFFSDTGEVPSPHRAEIKRLYTTPSARGLGLGKALVRAVIDKARLLGYDEVVLDTLPRMSAARSIYKSLGFERIEAYYDTPLEGTEFLRFKLKEYEVK